MDIRIYVGNLAKSTTQDEISTLFATAGAVTSVELVKDKGTGQSKGFAFVSMASQADADHDPEQARIIGIDFLESGKHGFIVPL